MLPRGKDTTTTFHHASASEVILNGGAAGDGTARRAIRVDVTADRFLRRQVYALVRNCKNASGWGGDSVL